MFKYIRGNKYLSLILSSDKSGILKWYIDEPYSVHPNKKGHIGGGITMGRGKPISASRKQNINTRSSTESEIIVVDQFIPSVLWTSIVLEAWGCGVTDNIFSQDNKSAILMENNVKPSSSKRTKQINIIYFYIIDRILRGEILVEWCSTGEMTRDLLTKPNQGSIFRRFRDLGMGFVPKNRPK